MAMNSTPQNEFNDSSITPQSIITMLFATGIGLLLALVILPLWAPNMAYSLGSDPPKVYWYISRSTAFVALSLLWISMALGLGITNKMARLWPGAPAAFAIHEYVSLLGIAFAAFHALILLGDHYINFTLTQLLIPFSTQEYRPLWVGLGQAGFYIWVIVAVSFYIRPLIGQKSWRFLHYASFAIYLMAIFHGIFSGTDTNTNWAQKYYWYSIGSLLFLLLYRITSSLINKYYPENKTIPIAGQG